MPFVVVPIVEGHSEVQSVPVLLRRLLAEQGRHQVRVAKPVRVGRYKVVRPGELERAIELARRTRENCDAILAVLDADDDCPAELAPTLLERAMTAVEVDDQPAMAARFDLQSARQRCPSFDKLVRDVATLATALEQ